MSAEASLLELLVCPESHQPLAPAEPQLIAELNERIARGELKNHGGGPVDRPLQEGLLRQDGKALYRVDDELPNMLIDERIDL